MGKERIIMMVNWIAGRTNFFTPSISIITCLEPTCCEASIGRAISVICVNISCLSTVRSVDLKISG